MLLVIQDSLQELTYALPLYHVPVTRTHRRRTQRSFASSRPGSLRRDRFRSTRSGIRCAAEVSRLGQLGAGWHYFLEPALEPPVPFIEGAAAVDCGFSFLGFSLRR